MNNPFSSISSLTSQYTIDFQLINYFSDLSNTNVKLFRKFIS